MNYEKNKKQMISVLVAVVLAFAFYKVVSDVFLINIENKIMRVFVGELIFSSATVIAAISVKKIWTLKPEGKGLVKGLVLGMPMIIIASLLILMWFSRYLKGIMSVSVSSVEILILIVAALLVGISEELLIRGILINGLLDYYGKKTPATFRKAVMLSAVFFGAIHIFNVFNGVTFISAFIQAVNAFFIGVMFGAIYIRTGKNLWPCILIHALWDFAGFIKGDMLNGAGANDVINQASFTALIPSALFVVYALFLLRNKMIDKVSS